MRVNRKEICFISLNLSLDYFSIQEAMKKFFGCEIISTTKTMGSPSVLSKSLERIFSKKKNIKTKSSQFVR